MTTVRRLLFVEDDPLIGALLVPLIEELEFEVVAADRGDDALRLLDQERFAWILTDLKLPGASGLDVLRRARLLDPDVRLAAMSGYADEEVRAQIALLGGKLLHKPFGTKQLRLVLEL